jgi:Domain of unknown function (DUF4123)
MRVTLQASHGPHPGPQVEIAAGQVSGVGRNPEQSKVAIPNDEKLAELHFYVGCSSSECRIKTVEPNQTLVNGKPASETKLGDAAVIQAGGSEFRVRVDECPLLEFLRGQTNPLYAVLDAARSPDVLRALRASGQNYVSLYEGEKGEAYASVAPYLVALPPENDFLPRLLEVSWGRSWGIYLTCHASMPDLRRHLRRFLMVSDETGRRLVFRYYDPRVLRVFLPACAPAEAGEFLGFIRSFLVETEDPGSLARFSMGNDGLLQEAVALAP